MTPKAPRIYASRTSLFLDFGGDPLEFPFTEGGLAKALKAIPVLPSPPITASSRTNLPSQRVDRMAAVKVAPSTRRRREVNRVTSAELRNVVSQIIREVL